MPHLAERAARVRDALVTQAAVRDQSEAAARVSRLLSRPIRPTLAREACTIVTNPWAQLSVVAFFVLASTPGCGPAGLPTYPVEGTVHWEGQPVEKGDIVLISVDNSVAPDAGKIVGGTFTLRAKAGKKRIEIFASREAENLDRHEKARPLVPYIPHRYNVSSELEQEVTAEGPNSWTFDLPK